jgi:hypothetical protein
VFQRLGAGAGGFGPAVLVHIAVPIVRVPRDQAVLAPALEGLDVDAEELGHLRRLFEPAFEQALQAPLVPKPVGVVLAMKPFM